MLDFLGMGRAKRGVAEDAEDFVEPASRRFDETLCVIRGKAKGPRTRAAPKAVMNLLKPGTSPLDGVRMGRIRGFVMSLRFGTGRVEELGFSGDLAACYRTAFWKPQRDRGTQRSQRNPNEEPDGWKRAARGFCVLCFLCAICGNAAEFTGGRRISLAIHAPDASETRPCRGGFRIGRGSRGGWLR
jgi:hypothetical protein